MSTAYHRLAAPVTSVRVTEAGGHRHLDVWVDHKLSGRLTLDEDVLPGVLGLLALDVDPQGASYGDTCLVAGGKLYEDPAWPDDLQLVDEYGRLTTLGALRGRWAS